MNTHGTATILTPLSKHYALGYFIAHSKLYKLILYPCKNPPLKHQCVDIPCIFYDLCITGIRVLDTRGTGGDACNTSDSNDTNGSNVKSTSDGGNANACNEDVNIKVDAVCFKNSTSDMFQFTTDYKDICGHQLTTDTVEFKCIELLGDVDAEKVKERFFGKVEEEEYLVVTGELVVNIA